MREILISFSIFLSCVLVAVISQIIEPSKVAAQNFDTTIQSEVRTTEGVQKVKNIFELDPEDPNPTLFAMASDQDYKSHQLPPHGLFGKPLVPIPREGYTS